MPYVDHCNAIIRPVLCSTGSTVSLIVRARQPRLHRCLSILLALVHAPVLRLVPSISEGQHYAGAGMRHPCERGGCTYHASAEAARSKAGRLTFMVYMAHVYTQC